MPPKRKHLDERKLETLLETINDGSYDAESRAVIRQLQAMVQLSKATRMNKPVKPTSIATSSLKSMSEFMHLTGLKYQYGKEEHSWDLPATLDRLMPLHHPCAWLEKALRQFRDEPFWHSESAEPMYIIPVDMILLDRMLEKQNQDAARNLFIKGDVTLL
ncbi:MAG: hypothetical protein MMC33_006737, partial [Icmadophila ericetorum]|nr:hypothetical protein [Icmadophila ericetorum]